MPERVPEQAQAPEPERAPEPEQALDTERLAALWRAAPAARLCQAFPCFETWGSPPLSKHSPLASPSLPSRRHSLTDGEKSCTSLP